ncbi:MAG TPA: hypothetical protein VIL63_11070, partial [Terriglobales bacterium]
LLYGWIVALIALLRALRIELAAWCARQKLPGRLKKTAPQRCVKLSDPAYKRPDPMIYDQYYLMKQGIAVTWDNPDITLQQGGIPVPQHALQPNTVYDIVARIWNSSTEAPVVGLPVYFSYLSFGAGTQSHFINKTNVNLGVKGGPNQPAYGSVQWLTPATPGHYCLQVFLEWLDDANPNNNLGQSNTDVVAAHSPAGFTFQLRNGSTRQRQAYRFEVDAYTIPPLLPCNQQRAALAEIPGPRTAPGTVLAVPPRHNRQNYPLPPDWTITFAPVHPVLAPDEEITIHATLVPPGGFHGRQPVNVHVFDANGMTGGVSVYIDVP